MKSLILKYFTDSLNETETEQLLNLLEKPENLKEFQAYAKENYHLDIVYDGINEEAALLKVKSAIQSQEKPVRRFYWRYAAAAFLVGVLISSYFFKENLFNTQQDSNPIIVNNNIEVGTDKATLTLEDGSEIVLEKGQTYISKNLSSNGEELVYSTLSETKPEIAYNYLTVPRGGQYFIKLSDGTQVWLNSESKLKYPVAFVEGETRKVELLYGEAYFDVSPSTEHQGAKFKVLTAIQEVEVLGTEFNIKAYEDENSIYTTLVEGKVAINASNNQKILKPKEQFIFNKLNNNMLVSEVDVYSETAWKKGLFSFKNKTLRDIMTVLSRWYDIDVLFEDKNIEDIQFKGVLSKNQNIEDILTLIKNTNFINAYEIKNNTIILK